MEKILMIREVEETRAGGEYYVVIGPTYDYIGYEVVTDKQTIEIKIDNSHQCCETWGFFSTNDNISDFIGADLYDVYLTDGQYTKVLDEDGDELYGAETMFITLNTSRGPLQLAVYNDHNGYYGHTAFVKSTQLNHSEVL